MKKIYLILFYNFIFGLTLNAQAPYQKMIGTYTTDWYIFQDGIPVRLAGGNSVNTIYINQGKYTAMTDTFLLGNTYKKMIYVYNFPSFIQNDLLGYIREDSLSRKVYFLEKNTTNEIVLYDFSLVQGNTITLNFPGTSGQFPAGSYTVHTADTVLTRVGYRKRLKLVSPSSDTLIHIESIGSIIHPLYIYQSYYGPGQFNYYSGCHYPYDLGLACKFSNNQKFFQSCTYTLANMIPCIYKYDSCNYYNNCSAINELNSNMNHKITPNPSVNQINLEIELENGDMLNVDIYDVSGRKVKSLYADKVLANNTISMDVSSIENGYYILRIYNRDININSPIIIAK